MEEFREAWLEGLDVLGAALTTCSGLGRIVAEQCCLKLHVLQQGRHPSTLPCPLPTEVRGQKFLLEAILQSLNGSC